MTTMLKLTLSNIRAHRARFAFTAVAVALVVAFMAVTLVRTAGAAVHAGHGGRRVGRVDRGSLRRLHVATASGDREGGTDDSERARDFLERKIGHGQLMR